MSSRLGCTACLRAWRSSCVVFSSSTETRRPRSAMRSMVLLSSLFVCRCASATGPALPHAELEDREVGGLEQRAGGGHDLGRARARLARQRQKLCAGLELGAVALAQRRHQRLERLRRQGIGTPVAQVALDPGGERGRLGGSGAVGRGFGYGLGPCFGHNLGARRLGGSCSLCSLRTLGGRSLGGCGLTR